MADFGFNTNLTVQQPQGNSLSDVVNMARGVQAYQKQAATMPYEIQQAKTLSEASKFALTQAQISHLKEEAASILNDPDFLSGDKSKVLQKLHEAKTRAQAVIDDPVKIANVFAPLEAHAIQNPEATPQVVKNLLQSNIGATGQQSLQTPQLKEINQLPFMFKPGVGLVTPLSEQGQQTTAPAAPSGAPAAAPAAPGSAPAAAMPSLIPNEVKVTAAPGGVMNEQQKGLYNEGAILKSQATSQALDASEGKQTIRKIKDTIKQAAGSAPGQALRSAGKWIAGNEELDTLTKNLADLQMRNAKLMGVDTDAARETGKIASGSENITAGALQGIVERADATNTAVIAFNKGLDNYEGKRQRSHAYVNTRQFKQAWTDNYDPRIFMIQNINRSDASEAQKQLERQKVLKGVTESEMNILRQKAENIKRLEQGNYQ